MKIPIHAAGEATPGGQPCSRCGVTLVRSQSASDALPAGASCSLINGAVLCHYGHFDAARFALCVPALELQGIIPE